MDEAVDVGREAVDATPAGHPALAAYLTNFAAALLARFERTRVLTDLDSAVAVHREAAKAGWADEPYQAARLINLGHALRKRFEHTAVAAISTML